VWKPDPMSRSSYPSPRHLPKPVTAGIGFASRAPQALADLGLRLPALAFGAVQGARARYEEYARVGADILGRTDDDPYADEDADDAGASSSLFAVADEPDESAGAQAFAQAAADRESPPANVPNAADLPIENYDGLSLPQLRGRLRSLSVPQLELIRDYESAHGRRLPVLTMLENRLTKLSSQD
jgi:hypothetical protein